MDARHHHRHGLRGAAGVGAVTITVEQYFRAYVGHAEITPEIHENAVELLGKVNALLEECVAQGWTPRVNPVTGTLISGQQNGGWRPQACPVGAPSSSHKQGRGVDIADGNGELDAMVDAAMLERHGLYKEHEDATPGWLHVSDRAPRSGNRVFFP